jgi:hypothetical protein
VSDFGKLQWYCSFLPVEIKTVSKSSELLVPNKLSSTLVPSKLSSAGIADPDSSVFVVVVVEDSEG